MDPRLTLPVPAPELMEEAVAAALRIRDFDLPLEQFWPRSAFVLAGQERTDTLYEALDTRWAELRAKTVHDLIEAASRETDRIQRLVFGAPPAKQAMEWTVQRGALSDAGNRNRADDAFRAELIGPDWKSRVDWLARMNEWNNAGAKLKDAWREWRFRAALAKAPARPPREPALERQIGSDPDDPTPRQIYADWLQEQEVAVGEVIALRLLGRVGKWKADLLEELTDVLGPLTALLDARVDLTQPRGFFEAAHVAWNEPAPARVLAMVLDHPASVTLERLDVDDGTWAEVRGQRLHRRPGAQGSHDGLVPTLVAAGARPCLEWLTLRALSPPIELSPLAQLYPRLRELEARCEALVLSPGSAWPSLSKLVLESSRAATMLEALATWEAPKLEELAVHAGAWPGAGAVGAAVGRFRALKIVTTSGLMFNAGELVPFLGAIRTPNLSEVHLEGARAGVWAVDELIAAADDLGHLRRLTLGESVIGPEHRKRLSHALPKLQLGLDDEFGYGDDGDDDD